MTKCFIKYRLPVVCIGRRKTGKRYIYILFYFYDNKLQKLKPFKWTFGVNYIKKWHTRKRQAQLYCNELAEQLQNGFSPYEKSEQVIKNASKNCEQVLNEICQIRMAGKRKDTIRTYKNFNHIFVEWLRLEKLVPYPINSITRQTVKRFYDYLKTERNCSNRTINNYRRFLLASWQEMIEREITDTNPFKEIKKMKEKPVKRRGFTIEEERVIIPFVKERDADLYLCIRLIHDCLLRDKDVVNIQIRHVDLKKFELTVPAETTKNHTTTIRTIPKPLAVILAKRINGVLGNKYLISSCLKLGPTAGSVRTLQKRHRKMLIDASVYEKGLGPYGWKDTAMEKLRRDKHFRRTDIKEQGGWQDNNSMDHYFKEIMGFNNTIHEHYPSLAE
ncbi:MAG: tyrosine-type recombinase/integrase [Chitinophagales bacterium]